MVPGCKPYEGEIVMRKRILSLTLTLTLVFALTPFAVPQAAAAAPDESIIKDLFFYTAVLKLLNKPDGSVITAADVSTITELSLNDSGVSNLTGIEYFTALKTLNCDNNSITELNISENIMLEVLSCMNNRLTKLDVSRNTALKQLFCVQNQLTALDLGNNTQMEYMLCNRNKLTALDISKSTELIQLNCSDNQLTQLDVSQNTKLRYLDCQNNSFSDKADIIGLGNLKPDRVTFDPQNNIGSAECIIKDPAFCAIMLELLYKPSGYKFTAADVAEITSLDISRSGITDLTGLEYFTKLEFLIVWDNPLTQLDVSKNTALRELYCGLTQLTELDLSHNPALVTLSCTYNKLTTLDVSQNPALHDLYVEGNPLSMLDTSRNPALENLQCGATSLLALDVSKNPALVGLYCEYNQLTELDVSHNPELKYLYCTGNDLTALDVSRNAKLDALNCLDNRLTELDVSQNSELRLLFCGGNKLTALDISHNPGLISLRCYENRLPGKSAITGLNESALISFVFDPQNFPAAWAEKSVNAAIEAGLVPEALQSRYTSYIERAEYCALTVALYEKITGKPITERKSFPDDGGDVNIQKLYGLGIISGSGGNFNPYGAFTRAEVAVITVQMLAKLGKTLPAASPNFADQASIPSWAQAAVGQMQNAGLMSGIGDQRFGSAVLYDRQSAIVLNKILYDRYK